MSCKEPLNQASGDYDRIYHQFKDIEGVTCLVELYKMGYTNSYVIENGGENPVTISHRGGDKGEWDMTIIQGQELIFNFYIPREDIYVIDTLMESEYKDWHGDFYVNGQLVFSGFLKPENMARRFETKPPYIEVSVSVTDGLSELKEMEFLDDYKEPYTGKQTLLQYIYYALSKTQLNLYVKIQVNTVETTIGTTHSVLDTMCCNASRFYEVEDSESGKLRANKCWDVIEIILKIFNAKLKQFNGCWYITNYHELNSIEMTYANLIYLPPTYQSEVITDNILDISDKLYLPYVELQKIHPLRSIMVYVQNENKGEDASGVDLAALASYVYPEFFYAEKKASGELQFWSDNSYSLSSPGLGPYIELASDFTITIRPGKIEYIKITFDYKLDEYSGSNTGGKMLELQIRVKKPDGTYSDLVSTPLTSSIWVGFNSYTGYNFRITEGGTYNIRISVRTISLNEMILQRWSKVLFSIKNIKITQYVMGEVDEYNPFTNKQDVQLYQKNIKGYEDLEIDLKLFDSINKEKGEIAAILGPATDHNCSALWNVYGGTKDLAIADIYARNILMNRSEYKNYIRCTIVDREQLITFHNIVQIQSKYYVFNSFSRDYRLQQVEAELVELIIGDIGDDYEEHEEIPLKSAIIYQGTENPLDAGYQVGHGFVIGDVIRAEEEIDGSITYYLAQADTIAHATAIGVVNEVLSDDVFRYVSDGYINNAAFTFEQGKYYYLSASDAGKLTTVPTYEEYEIEQAIGFGTDKGFKVEIDARNLNFKQIIEKSETPSGIPIFMHWENADIQDEDSFTESDLESADSGDYEYDAGDYDVASIESPGPIDCEYGTEVYESAGVTVIKKFITNLNFPGTTMIPSGGWFFETWVKATIQRTISFRITVYKRDLAGVETALFYFDQLIGSPNTVTKYKNTIVNEAFTLTEDDRLVFEYSTFSDLSIAETVILYVEGETPTHVKLPIFDAAFGYKEHNELEGLQGGNHSLDEFYHHTEDEIDTHVYEAPIDGNQYVRKDGEWVEIVSPTTTRFIDFEFCVNAGIAETFEIDIYAAFAYTITKAIVKCDQGTMDALSLEIDSTAITGCDDMDINDSPTVFTATESSATNDVAEGSLVTLSTSGTDTGTPTAIRLKIVYEV